MCSKKEEHYTWETLENIRDRLTSIEERLVAMEEYIELSVGGIEEKLNDTAGYDSITESEDRVTDLLYKCFDSLQSRISYFDICPDIYDRVNDMHRLILSEHYEEDNNGYPIRQLCLHLPPELTEPLESLTKRLEDKISTIEYINSRFTDRVVDKMIEAGERFDKLNMYIHSVITPHRDLFIDANLDQNVMPALYRIEHELKHNMTQAEEHSSTIQRQQQELDRKDILIEELTKQVSRLSRLLEEHTEGK